MRFGGADMAASTLTLRSVDSGAFAPSAGFAGHFTASGEEFVSLVNGSLQVHGLEPLPARGQEAGGLQPVQHPMVEREAEVHHRLDPDHAVDRNRPLYD